MRLSHITFKTISFWYITVFFLVAATLSKSPWTLGDGYEYMLQTASVQNHLTFGATEADLELAKSQFITQSDGLERTYQAMAVGENGYIYSNHFGAYAVLVTPIKQILLAFEINPIYAFPITNGILWLSAIIVVCRYLRTSDRRKFGLIILLTINPIYFYITWVHPEVYLFSFCVIGLVFYYNRQYAHSITALSVAAMQNPGILPIAMMAGIQYIWDLYVSFCKDTQENNSFLRFLRDSWHKIISYGVFYIPAFLPIITCYIHFGVINRVAAVAMEKEYLLSKMKDYLFDLNIGIFPYEPIVLLLFFILILRGLCHKEINAFLNLLTVCGMLFIISLELQINCGMEGIMRYNVWIIPVMIFFIVWNLGFGFIKNSFVILLQGIITLTMIVCTLYSDYYYQCTQFAPWTRFVINYFPQLYHPSHGIFYSRTLGYETYYSDYPVVAYNSEGFARKILLSAPAETVFWGDDYLLVSPDGSPLDKRILKTHRIDDGNFLCIDITEDIFPVRKYNLGSMIYFSSDQFNANDYVAYGMSTSESWGSWTDGDEMKIRLWVEESDSKKHNVLTDVVSTFYQPQYVEVLLNEDSYYSNTIEGNEDIMFSFSDMNTHFLELTYLLPDSVRPSDVMQSGDNRDLGIGIYSLCIR